MLARGFASRMGRGREAVKDLREALATFNELRGAKNISTLRAQVLLAGALAQAGQRAEADSLLAPALQEMHARFPAGHFMLREAETIAQGIERRR